ncbi:MAG: excinuclease ABC subunit UvrA, partial [Acidimicrobiales bacterium]|nr:excinuclease ABC subunit UvrA [Acidimicrobiales bacterium]
RLLRATGEEFDIPVDKPWSKLTTKQRKLLLYGSSQSQTFTVRYRNRYGRSRSYTTHWEGVIPTLQRRHADTDSDHSRDRIEGYMREVPCGTCDGARLNEVSLAVRVAGRNIHELCSVSIGEAAKVIDGLSLNERETIIAAPIVKEIDARLNFLLDVGLDYLTLNRSAATLAGGEAQRIRLASQIGSGLEGVLYVLDEPSIGLHQRDNRRLIETLQHLRDLGNTVLVVEHDQETILEADWVVDIGPGAGEHGGEIIYSGPVKGLKNSKGSITGEYLKGTRVIEIPTERRKPFAQTLTIKGARENNLRSIDVEIPLGCFVTVTGVSGSGKSTLINEILRKSLMQRIYKSKEVPGLHTSLEGWEELDKVIDIDQSPIGRTPRSNPATYTGAFDNIRKLFAATNESKVRGYLPGRFSFNVKGGRCEACSGDGTLKIEMHFLPDVYVPCEVCKGARYNRETLEIRFKGMTIADVLNMPCEEALAFFSAQPPIARHMQTLVDVGLGYIRLGQPATTLSGGEAQRVKLASELAKRPTGHTIYILDEPTTGLHFEDIRRLLAVLSRLVDQGNTVIIIEHNLDVIKTADWIIDMGPEGGDGGGLVVASGPPEKVAKISASHTARFLAPVLSN